MGLIIKSASAFAFPSDFLWHRIQKHSVKAIAFDAFTLFDTASVVKTAEQLFPGKTNALMTLWRNRQFEYTWLRGLSKQYKDFWLVTEDALKYATTSLQLDLTAEKKDRMMQALLEMHFVPDAAASLNKLKQLSLKLAILSNATYEMLEAGIKNSGLQTMFDFVISTDNIKTYKPDPSAYQLAIDAFKLSKEEIMFVAFGGWDAAGAKSFGYPTVWINTSGLPIEQLGSEPDFICGDMNQLVSYVTKVVG